MVNPATGLLIGGFLLGFGTCLLIIGALGHLALARLNDLESARALIEQMYVITHGQGYVAALGVLRGLLPYTEALINALRLIGLGQLANQVARLGDVVNYMERLQGLSEEAHRALSTLSLLPIITTYIIALGAALVILGTLVARRYQFHQRSLKHY